jgi:hypothetical protein
MIAMPAIINDHAPENPGHPMAPAFERAYAAWPLETDRLLSRLRPWLVGSDWGGETPEGTTEHRFAPEIDTIAVDNMLIPDIVVLAGPNDPPARMWLRRDEAKGPFQRVLSVESGFGTSRMHNPAGIPFEPRYRRQFSHHAMSTPIDLEELPSLRHVTFAFGMTLHPSLFVEWPGRRRGPRPTRHSLLRRNRSVGSNAAWYRSHDGEFVCRIGGADGSVTSANYRNVERERFGSVDGSDILS